MALRLGSFIEYALISAALYIFLISPLLSPHLSSSDSNDDGIVTAYQKSEALVYPNDTLTCSSHQYSAYILSSHPLVVYIESFLSDEEADELVKLSAGHFEPSTVFHAGVESHDPSIRNSSKALLPRDHVVQCLEQRAQDFQGWRKDVFVERLWAQKYGVGGHYVHHFDWGSRGSNGAGRVSTFMVYLHADCTGGGTNFPRLKMPPSRHWCKYLECDGRHDGITFKARKGSAVYWENFKPDGSGFEETWHAGLPVESGTKIGLNIWSWYQPGYTTRSLLKSTSS